MNDVSILIKKLTAAFTSLESAKGDLIDATINDARLTRQYASWDVEQLLYIFSHAGELPAMLTARGIAVENRIPFGKVAVVLPFNGPGMTFGLGYVGAKLAGNDVVIKPAGISRNFFKILEKRLRDVGLEELFQNKDGSQVMEHRFRGEEFLAQVLQPDSHINVIETYGHDNYITSHLEQLITASSLDKFILEGPGNNRFIVTYPLKEPERCAKAMIDMATVNSGQVCQASGKFDVDERVLPELLSHILSAAKKKIVGDPAAITSDIGPVRAGIALNIHSQLQQAKQLGAVFLYVTPQMELNGNIHSFYDGSKLIAVPDREGYVYIPLVVLTNTSDAMRIRAEEKFGPVIAIRTFSDSAQLVSEVEHDRYGLQATVFGEQPMQKHSLLMDTLEHNVGRVFVNETILDPGVFNPLLQPWGGYKNSRFGLYPATVGGRRVLVKDQIGPGYTFMDFSKER